MARLNVLMHQLATNKSRIGIAVQLMNQALGKDAPSRLRERSRFRRM